MPLVDKRLLKIIIQRKVRLQNNSLIKQKLLKRQYLFSTQEVVGDSILYVQTIYVNYAYQLNEKPTFKQRIKHALRKFGNHF